jgi:hypothetical protein
MSKVCFSHVSRKNASGSIGAINLSKSRSKPLMSDPPPECDNLFVPSIRLAPERDKPLPQPGKQCLAPAL